MYILNATCRDSWNEIYRRDKSHGATNERVKYRRLTSWAHRRFGTWNRFHNSVRVSIYRGRFFYSILFTGARDIHRAWKIPNRRKTRRRIIRIIYYENRIAPRFRRTARKRNASLPIHARATRPAFIPLEIAGERREKQFLPRHQSNIETVTLYNTRPIREPSIEYIEYICETRLRKKATRTI